MAIKENLIKDQNRLEREMILESRTKEVLWRRKKMDRKDS